MLITLWSIPLRPISLADCVSRGGGESSSSVKQEKVLEMGKGEMVNAV